MPRGFIAWHPAVHHHFGERLFFFLLALKPYRERAFGEALRRLLAEFGVPADKGSEGFCSYEVLGDFDHLIRVWLPAGLDYEFVHKAKKTLPNLENILQFNVQRVARDWRFDKALDEEFLKGLKPAKLAQAQAEGSANGCTVFTQAGAAKWVSAAPEKVSAGPIKAFISLNPSPRDDATRREIIEEEVIELITGEPDISECTFYGGVGFTWMLAKVVAKDFGALAGLVARVSGPGAGLGSTCTYAATRSLAQGDRLGAQALASAPETELPPRVLRLVPALNGPSPAGEIVRKSIVRFIEDKVPPEVKPEDEGALRALLEAVLRNDEEAAISALFLPTIQTERALREAVITLLEQRYGRPNAHDEARKRLTQKNQGFTSLKMVALGGALHLAFDQIDELKPKRGNFGSLRPHIEDVAKLRNRLMHGAEISLATHHPSLAEHLLRLWRIRDEVVPALTECLQLVSQA